MEVVTGFIPIIVRQTCGVAFGGDLPQGDASGALPAEVPYVPEALSVGGYEYAYERDRSEITLTKGGLYVFKDAVRITEVRSYCAGATITIAISDEDGTHILTLESAVNADEKRYPFTRLTLPKGQVLKITTTGAGTVDVYIMKTEG